ncbi:MAG: hypothetical protein ABW134_15405 [Candidatus Thiodiazotropha endolucinida]
MAVEVKSLDPAARSQRIAIRYDKPDHIDDEVIVTLMLDAWVAGQQHEMDTYASELLRRITMQVMAHVRKNPEWQRLGGGAETAIADFCEEVVLSILEDKTVPCHAEVAFGNYVYRRCLDEAGKLFAKKHSAGESLDHIDNVEAIAQASDTADSPAAKKSPEQALIELEDYLKEQDKLEKIRLIVQGDMPERPQLAFTFRYFGNMKIKSKKDEVTITRLMGVNDKTVTKYINQAKEIIKQRLSND